MKKSIVEVMRTLEGRAPATPMLPPALARLLEEGLEAARCRQEEEEAAARASQQEHQQQARQHWQALLDLMASDLGADLFAFADTTMPGDWSPHIANRTVRLSLPGLAPIEVLYQHRDSGWERGHWGTAQRPPPWSIAHFGVQYETQVDVHGHSYALSLPDALAQAHLAEEHRLSLVAQVAAEQAALPDPEPDPEPEPVRPAPPPVPTCTRQERAVLDALAAWLLSPADHPNQERRP